MCIHLRQRSVENPFAMLHNHQKYIIKTALQNLHNSFASPWETYFWF